MKGEISMEKNFYRVERHWMYFFWPLIATFVTGGIAIIWVLLWVLRFWFDDIYMTDDTFYSKLGVLRVEKKKILFVQIYNAEYKQSRLGALLGYGTLYVRVNESKNLNQYAYINESKCLQKFINKYAIHDLRLN